MASYPDNSRAMPEFEAFDRNGAFSGSPQGRMGDRPEMMNDPQMMNDRQEMMSNPQQQMMNNGYGGGPGQNPNPFSRRQGGGNDRVYTQDGFDPYSAYGSQFGSSQSGPGMQMGGGAGFGTGRGSGQVNGVKNDNTMGGFSYSSRNREMQGQMPGQQMQGGQYDNEGMGGGFDGPMEMMGGGFDGPMEMMGGFNGGPMEMMGGFDGGPMGQMDYQYEAEQMMQMQQQGGFQQRQGDFQQHQQEGGFHQQQGDFQQQQQEGGFPQQQQQGYGQEGRMHP